MTAPVHPGPLALIAEVTHRCPLHCAYCSNPLEMVAASSELTTPQWVSVFEQGAELGVLQLDLTGGEPLARPDIVELVTAARRAKLYVNLITSGIGLNDGRLAQLVDAGLDHLQLSFQDVRAQAAEAIAGTRVHARKIELARKIAAQPLAFTINIVVHRQTWIVWWK